MDLGLQDKVVFISGASRGIGFGIAQVFLEEGARVCITGRNEVSLSEAVDRLGGSSAHVMSVQGDMTVEREIIHALEKAEESFGPIDSFVANLGSGTSVSGFEVSREEWEAGIMHNLLGSVTLAQEALKRLTSRHCGNLTFISSIAGIEAIGAPVAYASAKAALQMAAKTYAREAGKAGVRVNVVAPGNVMFPGGTWDKKLEEREAFFKDYIAQEVPLQRFGKPKEVAHAVVFLASEQASFITGATLVVDGGQTRHYG